MVTTSPLVLEHADEVLLVEGGLVVARGSHHGLLADHGTEGRRYRSVVSRSEDDDPTRTEVDHATAGR